MGYFTLMDARRHWGSESHTSSSLKAGEGETLHLALVVPLWGDYYECIHVALE